MESTLLDRRSLKPVLLEKWQYDDSVSFPSLVSLLFPPTNQPQDFRQYRGHGCPVRNCGFLVDDASLVSSGGRDCAVMLWAFEARAGAEGVGLVDSQKGTGELYLYGNDPEVETVLMTEEDRLHHPDLKDLFRYVHLEFSYPAILQVCHDRRVSTSDACEAGDVYKLATSSIHVLFHAFHVCVAIGCLGSSRTCEGASESVARR